MDHLWEAVPELGDEVDIKLYSVSEVGELLAIDAVIRLMPR